MEFEANTNISEKCPHFSFYIDGYELDDFAWVTIDDRQ